MKTRKYLLAIVATLLMTTCLAQKHKVETPVRDIFPTVGRTFPLFEERDVNGKVWKFSDLEGHVTVFYLWQSATVQSLSAMNELSAWKQMYPEVLFLAATWQDPATARRVAQQYNFTWNLLCNVHELSTWVKQGLQTESGTVCRSYPVLIVTDREGTVRCIADGADLMSRQAVLTYILQNR